MSRRSCITIALLSASFALSALAALAWIGGELHYQSCVERVAASTSVRTTRQTSGYGGQSFGQSSYTITTPHTTRRIKLRECSRSPL